MIKYMVAMPAPDIEGQYEGFVGEIEARFDEFRQSRKRLGITREAGWLQQTPDGHVFVLLLEGDDPEAGNARFASSDDPFDVWFRERAGAILGVDFSQPIPVHPEPIYTSAPEGPRARRPSAWPSPSFRAKPRPTAGWPRR